MAMFEIEGFARSCKEAMAASADRHRAASEYLKRTMEEHSSEEIMAVLDAAIPPDADIGEMIVHLSPELTMLYGRVPPHFQSGIHDHTVFACIGQLKGNERNVFYERDANGALQVVGDALIETGTVLELPAEAIHHIENPGAETSGALHIYGGDFKAVQDQRRLWTSVDRTEIPFAFPDLMRESAIMMKRDGNVVGLGAMVEAMPKLKALVDGL